jgi:hypothetical protein
VNTIVSMPGEDMRGQKANDMSRKPTIGFVNPIHLGKTPAILHTRPGISTDS